MDRLCPICQEPLTKRANESWTTFNKRQACSPSCAAALRERKKIQAMSWPAQGLALMEAMKGWKPQC